MSILAHRNVFADQPSPAFLVQNPTENQLLQWNDTDKAFKNFDPIYGETITNIGTGEGIFESKVGTDFRLKTLKPGSFVSLTSDGDSITIAVDVTQSAVTGDNVGTGQGVFANKTGNIINLKSLKAVDSYGNLSVSSDTDSITYTNTAQNNTASNAGTAGQSNDGAGIFKTKTAQDLEFRRLRGTSNVIITEEVDRIQFNLDLSVTPNTAGEVVRSLADGTLSALNLPPLVTFPSGNHKQGLRTQSSDIEWSYGAMMSVYQFTVEFEADGSIESVQNLPSGWSSVQTGDRIEITHTEGCMPKALFYMGYDNQTQTYNMGFTNQAFNLRVANATKTTKFEFTSNSSVAGADVNFHAFVNVVF